ncbi:MAG TPA: hypothetical protein VJ850_03100 [Candidatus Limnocylindrales bacterium]|nr:hypothetical protein [Candidatus Limnocylindrales bacterium]
MIRRATLVAAIVSFALQGCSYLAPTPSIVVETPLPNFTTRVDSPDGVVGVVRSGTTIRLVFLPGGGGTSAQVEGAAPHVYLMSMGGETGATYNSWIFGIAPEGATTVELAGAVDAISAPMVDGVFLIGLKAKDIGPGALNWTFRSPGGAVVARGNGIRP